VPRARLAQPPALCTVRAWPSPPPCAPGAPSPDPRPCGPAPVHRASQVPRARRAPLCPCTEPGGRPCASRPVPRPCAPAAKHQGLLGAPRTPCAPCARAQSRAASRARLVLSRAPVPLQPSTRGQLGAPCAPCAPCARAQSRAASRVHGCNPACVRKTMADRALQPVCPGPTTSTAACELVRLSVAPCCPHVLPNALYLWLRAALQGRHRALRAAELQQAGCISIQH
jgi:hypothetical protein